MIGTRGHDVGAAPGTAAGLAREMQDLGMEAVQLVAYRSIAGIREQPGSLSHGLAWSVAREFEKRGIHLALLGSYFNMLERDESSLKTLMERFKEYIRYARDFGCPLVGTETGSYNADMSFHPDNHGEEAFRTIVQLFKELVSEAEKHGVMVGVEGVYRFSIHTPERMKRLLDAVDSNNLQVILDPVNLLHFGNYRDAKGIIEESFSLFGDKIVLIHAKDFVVEGDQIRTVPLGRGLMDFEHLLATAQKHKPGIDIIIEDLRGEELTESRQFLESIQNRIG